MNPLKPHDASKHNFTSLQYDIIPYPYEEMFMALF